MLCTSYCYWPSKRRAVWSQKPWKLSFGAHSQLSSTCHTRCFLGTQLFSSLYRCHSFGSNKSNHLDSRTRSAKKKVLRYNFLWKQSGIIFLLKLNKMSKVQSWLYIIKQQSIFWITMHYNNLKIQLFNKGLLA